MPAVIFDDGPADRQPHAHALGFGRKKRLENAAGVLWIDTVSGVLHCYQKAARLVGLRFSRNRRWRFITVLMASAALMIKFTMTCRS